MKNIRRFDTEEIGRILCDKVALDLPAKEDGSMYLCRVHVHSNPSGLSHIDVEILPDKEK